MSEDHLLNEANELLDMAKERIKQLEAALLGLKASIDTRINDLLCETKPDYDDSITGINDAWDVVRKACDEYIARAALAPEQDK